MNFLSLGSPFPALLLPSPPGHSFFVVKRLCGFSPFLFRSSSPSSLSFAPRWALRCPAASATRVAQRPPTRGAPPLASPLPLPAPPIALVKLQHHQRFRTKFIFESFLQASAKSPEVLFFLIMSLCRCDVTDLYSVKSDYNCDPTVCQPPSCHCASILPPGDLTTNQTIQMVMLTFDDAITTTTWAAVRKVLELLTVE